MKQVKGLEAGAKASSMGLYWRALREAKSRWPALGAVFALALFWTPISLLLPLPVKIILDNVTGSEPLPGWLSWFTAGSRDEAGAALSFALALSVAVTALVLIHNTVDWLLREHLAETIVRDTRQRLMGKSLELSAISSTSDGTQDFAYRVVHDAPSMHWVTLYGLMPIVSALASLLVLLVVTSQLSVTVAILALATSVPLILLVHYNQGRMRDGWHGAKELEAKTLGHVQESLVAWQVVVSSGQERRMLGRFESLSRSAFRAKLKVMGFQAVLGCMMTFGIALGTAAILYTAVQDIRAGLLTPGDLILITAYVAQLYGPIQTIATHLSSQQAALASVERNFKMLDQEPPIQDRPGAVAITSVRGEIEFRNVSFSYDPAHLIIKDCSFRIPAGSRVGISGPSGAGKTTLTNLLLRFLDPVEGSILLDGHDLRDYRLEDLRRQFALLGQDSLLLSGSLEENIAFGRPGATQSEIIQAAKLAQAHDFISALPEAYSTMAGEARCKLSGGQRQRVALARAHLKHAPILVLDEPTSALDAATEAAVIADLKRSLSGRTVFVITHRPSVLEATDLVLHLEKTEVQLSDRRDLAPDEPELLIA